MEKLYNNEGLKELNKIRKKYRILFYAFFVFTLIAILVFVLVSTYQLRTLYSVLCSIIATTSTIFAIYFFIVNRFYKRQIENYTILKDGESQTTVIEFVDISEKPMTLSDKSMAYEVKVKNKKGNKTFYLSNLFDNSIFVPGKEYKIQVLYDYIVGYEDER